MSFVYGNCVFGNGLEDAWAVFAVAVSSYGWLGEDAKHARFTAMIGALEAAEADVQILRVGRSWDVARYAREMAGTVALAPPTARSESLPNSSANWASTFMAPPARRDKARQAAPAAWSGAARHAVPAP